MLWTWEYNSLANRENQKYKRRDLIDSSLSPKVVAEMSAITAFTVFAISQPFLEGGLLKFIAFVSGHFAQKQVKFFLRISVPLT